jgi:hypothetical protein
MFIYLTTAIGMFGRSIGMHLFSLELVDIEENEYPTFLPGRAVSSSFIFYRSSLRHRLLTVPFNEEKRAVHVHCFGHDRGQGLLFQVLSFRFRFGFGFESFASDLKLEI